MYEKTTGESFARKVIDDSFRHNAENASGAGLEVRVSREYDGVGLSGGRICQFCKERECHDVTLQEANKIGAFQRHEGCACVIEYTSTRGVKTFQTGKSAMPFSQLFDLCSLKRGAG